MSLKKKLIYSCTVESVLRSAYTDFLIADTLKLLHKRIQLPWNQFKILTAYLTLQRVINSIRQKSHTSRPEIQLNIELIHGKTDNQSTSANHPFPLIFNPFRGQNDPERNTKQNFFSLPFLIPKRAGKGVKMRGERESRGVMFVTAQDQNIV